MVQKGARVIVEKRAKKGQPMLKYESKVLEARLLTSKSGSHDLQHEPRQIHLPIYQEASA